MSQELKPSMSPSRELGRAVKANHGNNYYGRIPSLLIRAQVTSPGGKKESLHRVNSLLGFCAGTSGSALTRIRCDVAVYVQ